MTASCHRLAVRSVLALAGLLSAPPAAAQALVPAGCINDAIGRDAVFLVQDEPGIVRFADAIRQRFFAKCRSMTDAEAVAADLAGTDVVVYGTPTHAWLAAHAERLPFRFGDGRVTVDGREFTGARLRLICSIKNPHDPAHNAVIYAAAAAADVIGINAVFHGPTGWVVADGDRVLASGDFKATAPLAPDEQRADLAYLRQMLADVHPATIEGLPAALAAALADAEAAATAPCTRTDLWRRAQRALLVLGDAHSSLAPPTSGERLDLPLVWLAEGLVVAADAGGLRAGDRVLAIGGRDEAALLEAMRGTIPAENPYWLKARGESLLTDLGLLQALGIAEQAPVRVRVARGDPSADIDVDVDVAKTGGDRGAPLPWVRFTLEPDHGLALFTLDRCDVDASYRAKLKEFFTAVHEQKIGRVAVDLRRNSGGNSGVVDEFLRYVDVERYTTFLGHARGSAAARSQRGLLASVDMPAALAKRTNDRHEQPPPFAGDLLVLVSGHTFSSGNWFAAVVQDNGLGKIVGEPTGNAPSSFGDVLSFQMPHSRLSFTLSFKKWLRPDPRRDPADAIRPDVPIARTAQSVRDRTDPVLDYLRRGR